MGKAIFGGISIAFMMLFMLSCGQTMVAPVHTVDWTDDIERDKREIMAPRNPDIHIQDDIEKMEQIYVYYGMAESTN